MINPLNTVYLKKGLGKQYRIQMRWLIWAISSGSTLFAYMQFAFLLNLKFCSFFNLSNILFLHIGLFFNLKLKRVIGVKTI